MYIDFTKGSFKNWFHSTQVNVNSLIPIRQYILPCINLLRIHTILANVERLESHGLQCQAIFDQYNFIENMNFTQRKPEILETGTISFSSLSKYDFHFTHLHET